MASKRDIYLSANILMKRHGKDAEEYAIQKLWHFQQIKDEEAASAWHSVIEAIKELRNTAPPEHLN